VNNTCVTGIPYREVNSKIVAILKIKIKIISPEESNGKLNIAKPESFTQ